MVVQGNPRVYKALRDQFAAVLDELRRIEDGQGVSDELLDTIQNDRKHYERDAGGSCLWGIDAKEKTARSTSVGADERQSIQKDSDNSIPASEAKGNGEMENLEEMYRKMQRMADPHYLHTLTMTELFQTSYKSRPPIIENLLHSGAYLLAGAPKIGKSFLVAQIAYHVSTGQELWGCKVHQGTVLYLALEDDFQRIQNRMFYDVWP